ncbi:hypothetical protein, partial [Paenibacillus darwinianus]|uniref:hypothetical protein n=1 Tax=Paenibacillus darwinianus TaxID=1380763 RepID=UPI001CBC286E
LPSRKTSVSDSVDSSSGILKRLRSLRTNTTKALPLFHPCGSDDRASTNLDIAKQLFKRINYNNYPVQKQAAAPPPWGRLRDLKRVDKSARLLILPAKALPGPQATL